MTFLDDLMQSRDNHKMHNIFSEYHALFYMLNDEEAHGILSQALTSDHFYDAGNRAMFENMGSYPIDISALGMKLRDKMDMTVEQIYEHIKNVFDYASGVSSLYNQDGVIRELEDWRIRRSALDIACDMAESLNKPDASTEEVICEAQDKLLHSMGGIEVDKTLRELALAEYQREEREGGMDTGFSQIKQKIGDFYRKELHILFGLPGTGKSALALNISKNLASAGHSCMYFCLEDTIQRVTWRIMAMQSEIPLTAFKHGLSREQQDAFVRRAGDKIDLPLKLDESCYTMGEMFGAALKRKNAVGLDFVVIDNASFVSVPRSSSEVEKAKEIGRLALNMAKQLDVCVLLLAHAPKEAGGKSPDLSNVYGGQGLAQPAFSMIELREDEEFKRKVSMMTQRPSVTDINGYIVKNRDNAPNQMLRLTFTGKYMKFEERNE